jgi:hypothetical protein
MKATWPDLDTQCFVRMAQKFPLTFCSYLTSMLEAWEITTGKTKEQLFKGWVENRLSKEDCISV